MYHIVLEQKISWLLKKCQKFSVFDCQEADRLQKTKRVVFMGTLYYIESIFPPQEHGLAQVCDNKNQIYLSYQLGHNGCDTPNR